MAPFDKKPTLIKLEGVDLAAAASGSEDFDRYISDLQHAVLAALARDGAASPPNSYTTARAAVQKWIVPAPPQAFDDIVGNETALEQLRDAIQAPVKHKSLYAAYGMKMPKGALLSGPPGCGKTMFARAAASEMKNLYGDGVAVDLYKPVGTERLSKSGYLERKINDDMPLQRRWRGVHLIRWEQIHGPIPAGMALKCLDSDKLNTDPSNWELVPRGVLPRLNGGPCKTTLAYDSAPAALKPTILAVAKLAHQTRIARHRRTA